jgi:hypothetical protein
MILIFLIAEKRWTGIVAGLTDAYIATVPALTGPVF